MRELVVIKGAGDIASGVAHRLCRAGFRVVMTEIPKPTVIRRAVAFAEAVYQESAVVEGVTARLIDGPEAALAIAGRGEIAVLVDPCAGIISILKPEIVVDAVLAKKNLGTTLSLAPIVIALGPGFTAGRDAHAVIETKRGHYLGQVILKGTAAENTGVPGSVMGYTGERVLRAPAAGVFHAHKKIGDMTEAGEVLAFVDGIPVTAAVKGVLRGILHDGLEVVKDMKIGDIDPRGIREYCFTVSDKARSVAGGVLEAILYLQQNRG